MSRKRYIKKKHCEFRHNITHNGININTIMTSYIPIMDDYSQQTLCRIARNDKHLTTLMIVTPNGRSYDHGYFDSANHTSHFYKLGLAITTNTYLTDLIVCTEQRPTLNDNQTRGPERKFYASLERNSSIQRLEIHGGVEQGIGYEILKAYEKNNQQLIDLRISANLQNEAIVANTVRLCANLQRLELSSCHITNEQLLPIIDSIRKHSSLWELNLFQNRIGNDGCESLATLLEEPNNNIGMLQLQSNDIGNLGTIAIANSLTNNTNVRYLYFDGNPITLSSVEDVFYKLLCNTSSINSIWSSNHTLTELHFPNFEQPHGRLLQLNEGTNKSHVAILKILRYHPIDMKPLFGWGSEEEGEWTLKGLPYIIDWFNRATVAVNERGHQRKDRYKVDQKKLSAIYQFAKAMPLLFAAATPFVASHSHAKDESTKSLVEMESKNKVATENCCVIL